MALLCAGCLVVAFHASTQHASADVFTADFSNTTFNDYSTRYLGGWFGNQMSFDQWYGPAGTIDMGTDGLTVYNTTNSSFRGTVVFLTPDLFTDGAGTYSMQFNVSEISFYNQPGVPGVNGSGWVSIVEANGYDLGGSSADAIFVNTEPVNGDVFAALGNATLDNLASLMFETTGIHSISFEYSGTGAVGLAMGSIDGPWPHTLIRYDSASVSLAIPEPSSVLLVVIAVGAFCLSRRRRVAGRNEITG